MRMLQNFLKQKLVREIQEARQGSKYLFGSAELPYATGLSTMEFV